MVPRRRTVSTTGAWITCGAHRVLLKNDDLPDDLERQIEAFVGDDTSRRNHESQGHLTPADLDPGRGAKTLSMREEIKKQTIRKRRLQHQNAAE